MGKTRRAIPDDDESEKLHICRDVPDETIFHPTALQQAFNRARETVKESNTEPSPQPTPIRPQRNESKEARDPTVTFRNKEKSLSLPASQENVEKCIKMAKEVEDNEDTFSRHVRLVGNAVISGLFGGLIIGMGALTVKGLKHKR